FERVAASSRELAGTPLKAQITSWPDPSQCFEELGPQRVAELDIDVCVLALPNTISRPFVEALSPEVKILDLSSDWRFDDAWQYGWPERFREQIATATRVANPGCYATGMQAAIWPVRDLLTTPPHCFGVSGYSGAGTTPSPKNDPEVLRDNLLPYGLVDHTHEREVSAQMGHEIRFFPHVASYFRGISLTISLQLEGTSHDRDEVIARYERAYANEPLVHILRDTIPHVRDNVGAHHVTLGGFQLDATGSRIVIVATLDNLLKGAATQAMQNLNLMAGFPEWTAIL
ncbi:unnamed protein product, partial [Laminaria digitata]